ncbi:sensor histidine kinase [Kribbella sp. NPDC050124]|uniref:sensor histidine kinase n=1 Tax=Kribbella sp. NPDC050124 TaxID=3364114 RepID=UPI0037ACB757
MRRSALLQDVFLAVVVAGIALPSTLGGADAVGVLGSGSGVVGWGWLLYVAVHVPLVWRRRTPVVVFWAVLALVGLCVPTGVTGVFLIFAPLFALYTLARHANWPAVWPGVVVSVVALVGAGLASGASWETLTGIGAVLAVGCLLGVAWRLRVAAAAERARHLDTQARMAVAAERGQLAREVHDVVAHNLAVMVALADGAAATVASDPRQAGTLIEQTAATGRSALAEMRRLVAVLRAEDGAPERAGLDSVPALVDQVREAGLQVELSTSGRLDVPSDVGFVAYRIVQEALTNTLKHAGRTASADVQLVHSGSSLTIAVTDTGGRPAGNPADGATTRGHGLAGLTERVAAQGGTFAAGATAEGWRVEAALPLGDRA